MQTARQQITRDWWDFHREKHELFYSQVVRDEISCGNAEMAARRIQLLSSAALLQSTPDARELTRTILASGLLPAKALADAAHIALATVHRMDILLTWNCRHIANGEITGRLRRLVGAEGHILPEIFTPHALLGEE